MAGSSQIASNNATQPVRAGRELVAGRPPRPVPATLPLPPAAPALPRIDPRRFPVDLRLVARLGGAAQCLQLGVLPLLRLDRVVLLAIAQPRDWPQHRAAITAALGPVRLAHAEAGAIQAAIATTCMAELCDRAETRVPVVQSARRCPSRRQRLIRWSLALGTVLAVLAVPQLALVLLLAGVLLALLASSLLRTAALWLALTTRPESPMTAIPPAELPTISILVPLYDEPDIAPRLIARLERLDYPRHLLDVVLILEADDTATRTALGACHLPRWMRLVVVPEGTVRTKPRAMNYALDFCPGQIIGIYDAEDAPDPDQLQRVASHFAARGRQVACLQGALDYYNARTNLLARLFTAEYAAWFRVVMPALQRLGLPMPLGGTTVFARRAALESVGAWDAHNVTEDADLGIRLARHGLRTEMLATTTHEEANCRPRPWLAQRSRWIKGHLLTWAVHMRHPRQLWRDLGWRGFLGYQVVFLGAQSQVLLTPLLWSFWLLHLGLPHPLHGLLPPAAITAVVSLLLLAGVLVLVTAATGLTRTRHRRLWPALAFMPLYHPLAAIAGWRALYEAFRLPFYWAKTRHGLFDDDCAPTLPITALPDPSPAPESAESRRQRRLGQPIALVDPATIITTGMAAQTTRNSPASILRRVSKAREMWVRRAS